MEKFEDIKKRVQERNNKTENKTEYSFLSFMFDAKNKEIFDDINMIFDREGIKNFSPGDEFGSIDLKGYSECDVTDGGNPIEACHICFRGCHRGGIKVIKEILEHNNIDYQEYELYHKKY